MDKLELKHLTPYLPYGLKVQYKGIINGKERKEYEDKWRKENPYPKMGDLAKYRPIEEKIGLKIGKIKKVECWDNHTTLKVGIKSQGLKSLSPNQIKPILRPLSDYCKKGTTIKNVMDSLDCSRLVVCQLWDLYDRRLDLKAVKLETYEIMCKNHIDFNRLIEKGLAIDINTLNQTKE